MSKVTTKPIEDIGRCKRGIKRFEMCTFLKVIVMLCDPDGKEGGICINDRQSKRTLFENSIGRWITGYITVVRLLARALDWLKIIFAKHEQIFE